MANLVWLTQTDFSLGSDSELSEAADLIGA
jgi:hypothetical protein